MNVLAEDLGYFAGVGVPLDEHVQGNQLTCGLRKVECASVTREEGRILAALVAGRDVLEIGTGLGVSAWCMASLARRVVTIDPDPWVMENIRTPQSVVRLRHIDEATAYGVFDVAFIDGNHDYESVLRDFYDAASLLKRPGVVAFHDFNQNEVREAIELVSGMFSHYATFPTCGQLTIGVIS